LNFWREARLEFLEALSFYDAEQSGLGKRF
jgi:hypothetical protein